jgi:hypothetical protein
VSGELKLLSHPSDLEETMEVVMKLFKRLLKPIKNNIKGTIGELQVINKLKFKYVINNLMFHDGMKSVQIDHVVVTRSGIHVIETKNFAGRIYANQLDDEWVQVLGRQKNAFLSPVKQNEWHIRSLENVLQTKGLFHSYIVFTNKAVIAKGLPVTPLNRIRKDIMSKYAILTDEQVLQFYERIRALKKANTISRREHVKSIKQRRGL